MFRSDEQFKVVFETIAELMTPPKTPRRGIGFEIKERHSAYGGNRQRKVEGRQQVESQASPLRPQFPISLHSITISGKRFPIASPYHLPNPWSDFLSPYGAAKRAGYHLGSGAMKVRTNSLAMCA
jgi:hypothetical protein